MNRMIEALQNHASIHNEKPSLNIHPPFSARIMQEPMPANFKIPYLKTYNGLGDLVDHLESFKTLMLLC